MQNKPKGWLDTYAFYEEIIKASKAIEKTVNMTDDEFEKRMFENLRSKIPISNSNAGKK
jgi:hypothetical protein